MPSTTRSASRGRGVDVAPAVVVLVEDVRRGARVAGTEGRVLDERRVRGEGLRDGMECGQLLELDRDERCGLLGSVVGLCGDRGDGFAVVLRLACGEDGAVAALRPEAGHRVGQIGGGRHEANAWDLERCRRVDPADPRARHIEGDELDVEDVVVGQVGDVLLLPGDAGTAADPGCRLPDAHCGATFASGTADRSPTGGAAARRLVGLAARGCQHGLDDLLVAGAATQVAGEAFLDLGAGRVRGERQQRLGRDQLAGDAEPALGGAGVEERLLERVEPVAGRQPLDRGHARCRPPRPRASGTNPRSGRRPGRCTRRTRRPGSIPSCRSGRGRRGAPPGACGGPRRRPIATGR